MKKFLTICLMIIFIILPLTGFRSADQFDSAVKIEFKAPEKPVQVFTDEIIVKASFYNPVASQCDSTPLITASGDIIDTTRTTELRWCAVSWDLHADHGGPLKNGDIIEVYGKQGKHILKGRYAVKDKMNPRFKHKIDILVDPKDNKCSFDSVTVKNKKFSKFKKRIAEQAEAKAKNLKQQAIHNSLQKALNKIPFLGTSDRLRHENFVRIRYTVLNKEDISLQKPQSVQI